MALLPVFLYAVLHAQNYTKQLLNVRINAKICLAFLFIYYLTGIITLDPRYNALQYNVDSVIMWLRSWIPIFQGLTKAG